MTSWMSAGPLRTRQVLLPYSASLKIIGRHAARVPMPLVLSVLSRTVEKTLSMGLVVRM